MAMLAWHFIAHMLIFIMDCTRHQNVGKIAEHHEFIYAVYLRYGCASYCHAMLILCCLAIWQSADIRNADAIVDADAYLTQ